MCDVEMTSDEKTTPPVSQPRDDDDDISDMATAGMTSRLVDWRDVL